MFGIALTLRRVRLPKAALPDGCLVGVLVGVGEVTESVFAGRYRKRPVEIEASQWDGGRSDAARFTEWSDGRVRLVSEMHAPLALAVYTLEGVMKADPLDWIVRGVQGEFYPVKPDIFEQTYEAVDA